MLPTTLCHLHTLSITSRAGEETETRCEGVVVVLLYCVVVDKQLVRALNQWHRIPSSSNSDYPDALSLCWRLALLGENQ